MLDSCSYALLTERTFRVSSNVVVAAPFAAFAAIVCMRAPVRMCALLTHTFDRAMSMWCVARAHSNSIQLQYTIIYNPVDSSSPNTETSAKAAFCACMGVRCVRRLCWLFVCVCECAEKWCFCDRFETLFVHGVAVESPLGIFPFASVRIAYTNTWASRTSSD